MSEPVTLELLVGLDQREPVGQWAKQGLCRDLDPDLFFPERGDAYTVRAAKAVCAECPVRVPCLDHALEQREVHGIWGGTSERERRRMRRELRLVAS